MKEKKEKNELKKDDSIDFEVLEANAPVKAVKADSSSLYISLQARLSVKFAGFWYIFHVSETADKETGRRKASRVSIALAGVSVNSGRFAKIESGKIVFVFASLKKEATGETADYRPSFAYTPAVEARLEAFFVEKILADKRLKEAFMNLYQKNAGVLKPETREKIKQAFMNLHQKNAGVLKPETREKIKQA